MKRTLFTFILLFAISLSAMSMRYEEARRRAWFLTDKMAYELNLTPGQYERAYEINLDYLMSLRSPSDCSGPYWRYRDADFRCILFDWQYNLFCTLDYFFRPVRWVRSAWYYPIVHRYRVGYYYFERPAIYVKYRGRGWRRRSHNDPSPYYGIHFDRGHGMRDYYHNGHNHRPSRPDYGHKPHRPDRPGKPNRPGQPHRPGRPNMPEKPNSPVIPIKPLRPIKPDNSTVQPIKPGQIHRSNRDDKVVLYPNHNSNHGRDWKYSDFRKTEKSDFSRYSRKRNANRDRNQRVSTSSRNEKSFVNKSSRNSHSNRSQHRRSFEQR